MDTELASKPEVKAIIDGKELTELPDDLFIPPDALEVLLDSFSGPLDLLLYLIRKQNIDILDIPIVSITKQYLHYIQLMECRRLELAADYLLMAAMLAEIKSRLLLPAPPASDDEEEEDPRMSLVRKLQAYEQIKLAAELLDALPRQEREHFLVQIAPSELERVIVHPDVHLEDLIEAMKSLLQREEQTSHHQISREVLSVRERMSHVLSLLQEHNVLEFSQLFSIEEGRIGLVVSLLAILELARQSLVVITQNEAFSPIHLQAA
ncbi:segregation and condensation protein A [Fluoribacter gormanii]|uniref:Segregation and condensation protein A n=1 Tax=Fluoribacter gormanii TaxID=464 RepID=A0A377GJA6_9GAMM|nr:ScpA family protein [Fluoribacter gormanii]KTD00750.1 segregation and condensation protein A [Fluoribacter gormanii]MCW8443554.1 segregation/condensation protein A [Fluoribacter gormanii]SIQ75751.1 condensin subunit ScpA [Fluoribacter gormanii]STO24897.1 Segregation and condensation protein A [Fluoribacter gormanii]